MNDLIVVPQTSHWNKLKSLVLDSVSSPITKRVYNLGLDEFFAWLSVQEPRPNFTKATVSAWRVALEARGLAAASINVRCSRLPLRNRHPTDRPRFDATEIQPATVSGHASHRPIRARGILEAPHYAAPSIEPQNPGHSAGSRIADRCRNVEQKPS